MNVETLAIVAVPLLVIIGWLVQVSRTFISRNQLKEELKVLHERIDRLQLTSKEGDQTLRDDLEKDIGRDVHYIRNEIAELKQGLARLEQVIMNNHRKP